MPRGRAAMAGAFALAHLAVSLVVANAQPVQPVSVTGLTLSTPCPIAVGTAATWSASAVGGTAPLEYKLWLRDEVAGTWTVLQDYSTSMTTAWRPGRGGTYRAQVWVRSAGATVAYEAWANGAACQVDPLPPASITSLTANPPPPTVKGVIVTFTATATGGAPPLNYRFLVTDGATGSTTILRDWSPVNQASWFASPEGTYSIAAQVRSAGSVGAPEATRTMGYLVPLPGLTSRASVGSGGVEGNSASFAPAVSADGRFVAFASIATNLVANDTNGQWDIFVRDRQANATTRVSLGPNGAQADQSSFDLAISADGRFVAFRTGATNIVPTDRNGLSDVFVHDRLTGVSTRVSVASNGSEANGGSSEPSLSADGRFVAFVSSATNLVPGDTNGTSDAFVHDRSTGVTTRVSVDTLGAQANGGAGEVVLSADGRVIAFTSTASNLVGADTNDVADVFVRDLQTGLTRRVNLGPGGIEANAGATQLDINADGQFVTFLSAASNLVGDATNGQAHVYVADVQGGRVQLVDRAADGTLADSLSLAPSLSDDGRFVAFSSWAGNLVPGDTNGIPDTFLADRTTGTVSRVSVTSAGAQGTGFNGSDSTALNGDGHVVLFVTADATLVAGDTNGTLDIVVRERGETMVPSVTYVSPAFSPAGGGVPGTQVTITAYTTGGAVEFRFWLFTAATGTWSVLRDYAPGASVTFQPPPGTYSIQAWVRRASSSAAYEGVRNSAPFTLAPVVPPALTTVTHNVTCPAVVGRWIATTAAATGGAPPVQYKFWLKDPVGTWTLAQDWSATPRLDWFPATPGNWVVQAWARSAGSVAPYESVLNGPSCTVTTPSPITSVTVGTSAALPVLAGEIFYVQAAATGGSAPLEYQFWQRDDASGIWTLLAPYSAFSQLPRQLAAGSYVIEVWVRSVGSSAAYDAFGSIQLHVLPATTTLESVELAGPASNLPSDRGALSADGRVVAFDSLSNRLVSTDTNGAWDVFVRTSGATTRASVSGSKQQVTGSSFGASLSADGRFVAFTSDAPDFVVGDLNGATDVFVFDQVSGASLRASESSAGAVANGNSYAASISGDGRFVAFASDATNLVAGDTNGATDIFVRDRTAGTTTRVSLGPGATQANGSSYGPSFSADGRYVAFASDATNLVAGDLNATTDVFVLDRLTATTSRVSVASGGAEASGPSLTPSISADGLRVAFTSNAPNLVGGDGNATWDVFVRDRAAGTTTRVSVDSAGAEAAGASVAPAISADGRVVAFQSAAPNLVSNDTNHTWDVFTHRPATGTTARVSLSLSQVEPDGASVAAGISGDGRRIVFTSSAGNMGPSNLNGAVPDVFVRDTAIAGPLTAVAVSYDAGNQQWRTYTSGGAGTVEYKFWLFTQASGWTVLRDWHLSGTAAWTPPGPGTYYVQGWVRTAGSGAAAPESAINSLPSVVP